MNRKYSILAAAALLISMSTYAQKDELKTLKKIFEKEKPSSKDVSQFKEALNTAMPLVSASNKEESLYLNFYKASIPFLEISEAMTKPENQANPANILKLLTVEKVSEYSKNVEAVLAYESTSGTKILTKSLEEDVKTFKPYFLSYAVSLENEKKPNEATAVMYAAYQIDKKDSYNLYYAAAYAINAKDYPTAYEYYKVLKDINFTGERTNYYAVSKINDKKEFFETKEARDKAILISHVNPTDEKEPSKRGEIYKNMALILVSEGKTAEAVKAVQEARKANPDDVSLISAEADLYLKTNDTERYAATIKEVIEKNPTNPDLFYNLGVTSYKNKDFKNAETYYLKAIELNPKYGNAFYNIAAIRLDEGQILLEQMNKLGTTPAENKKYDALREQRIGILKEGMKFLEKCIGVDNENIDAKEVLLSVYKALEMTDKAKALQAELDK